MTTQTSTEMAGSSAEVRANYLTGLLNLRQPLNSDVGWWLTELRDRATAHVRELAIPSTRDEEWRVTNLAGLLQVQFQAADQQPLVSLAEIQPFILPEALNSRLVFVDGVYDPVLSSAAGLPKGTVVSNLVAGAKREELDYLPSFLGDVQGHEEVFTALNTASMTDGAIVWVGEDQEIDTPIHVLYVSTATQPTIAHPRCLVIVCSNSKLKLVEEFVALRKGLYFTNSVTEVCLWDNAEVNHTRIQRDSGDSFHVGKTAVGQAWSSRYTCNAVSLGAKLSRHNLEVHQYGEATETTLNGLTMIHDAQVADTHSAIVLTKPHGTTRQLHKCIIDDRAHAVFNGKVFVPKAAQMTNAAQLNRNLLLSPKARIDTKPQLEIVADNVKCTHGATVGQLEADQVFYLQSRGIDAESAKKLLVYAFADEILEQIAIDSLRQTLSQLVSSYQSP